MKYYIAENGQTSGPFEIDELQEHGLTVNSLVWNDTLTGWTKAGEVAELQGVLNTQPAYVPPVEPPVQASSPYAPQQEAPAPVETPPPYTEPQQPAAQPQNAQQQYAQPQYEQRQVYGQPAQSNAPQALMLPPDTNKTLAIIILVVSALCCCNPLSMILAIISLVKSSNALASFHHGDTITAADQAQTARNLALAALIALIIMPVLGFLLMMLVPDMRTAFTEGYYQGYNL